MDAPTYLDPRDRQSLLHAPPPTHAQPPLGGGGGATQHTAPAPLAPSHTRGAPQFVSSNPALEDELASVRIHESKGWRSMFPDLPDTEGGGRGGCCSHFKFAIWATIAVALVAAAIGLSIAMVVINSDRTSTSNPDSEGPYFPPGTIEPGGGGGPSPSPSPLPNTDQDGGLVVTDTTPPFPVPSGWTALWWDEFDGTALNMKYWNYDVGYGQDYGLWAWGNQEQEYYSPKNVQVGNGVMTITAQREETTLPTGYTFNYTSGRINTRGKLGFYGGMTTADGKTWDTVRIEASIKSPMPTPEGLWVAFWFLPVDMRYGVWASSGEMDLYEMKNDFTKCNFALHYGGPWPKANKRYNLYFPRQGGGTFYNDFTTVTMDWSTTSITMSMNGAQVLSKSSIAADPNGYYSDAINAPDGAPFDIPFYIIINMSVGGRYPGNATDATVLPNTFQVDYIRVYGKNS